MKEQDIEHLKFIYNRMKDQHEENVNIDYMIKFNEIINRQVKKREKKIRKEIRDSK